MARKHLWSEIASGRVELLKGSIAEGYRRLKSGYFKGSGRAEMVFIDACHDYEAVLHDIRAGVDLLGGEGSGGLLCGHDYNPYAYPDVVRAVNEKFANVSKGPDWLWSMRV